MAKLAVRIASALAGAVLLIGCSDFGGAFTPTNEGGGPSGTAELSDGDNGSASDDATGSETGPGDGGTDSTVGTGPDAEPGSSPQPDAAAPEAAGPQAGLQEAGPIETAAPEATAPETSAPEASAPEAGAHEASAPEASAPEASAAEAAGPDAAPPDATAPEASAPEASGPEAAAPDAAPPDATAPEAAAPDAATEAAPPDASTPEAGHDASAEAEAGFDMCDPTNPTANTKDCFGQRDKLSSDADKLCSSCMATNCFDIITAGGPGVCETVAGNANLLSGALPDGKTCSTVFAGLPAPLPEVTVCLATLDAIFKSGCAKSTQLTPCLCGTADVLQCTTGQTQPLGPVYDVYACDFGSTSGGSIFDIFMKFSKPTFGFGQANAIAECAGSFNCDCF